jgi:ABC-type multidrug transport system ATPase subunit
VLFLDEPTSGLDSFTANEVMTTVKALVADGGCRLPSPILASIITQ